VLDVALRPIDEETLDAVLKVAVADAEPDEVMPPCGGSPDWTKQRQQAFRDFHHGRRAGLEGPLRELGLAIVANGEVLGIARLQQRDDDRHEIGVWIGRSHRGRGVGTAALAALRSLAVSLGVRELVAQTTSDNTAALAVLRRHGADLRPPDDRGVVRARLAPRSGDQSAGGSRGSGG
jgi:RimJ/RimL family protein N-acetyltransferase